METLIEALTKIAPEFSWQNISTGGGCTAIRGQHSESIREIMVTDGDANRPGKFTDEAIAIYWEDHKYNQYWASKSWTEPKPFFELLSELKTDVQNWSEETTPREALINRLSEWADDIENEETGRLGLYTRTKFADDLRTAVALIITHTGEK
jgi:hypothetical protein